MMKLLTAVMLAAFHVGLAVGSCQAVVAAALAMGASAGYVQKFSHWQKPETLPEMPEEYSDADRLDLLQLAGIEVIPKVSIEDVPLPETSAVSSAAAIEAAAKTFEQNQVALALQVAAENVTSHATGAPPELSSLVITPRELASPATWLEYADPSPQPSLASGELALAVNSSPRTAGKRSPDRLGLAIMGPEVQVAAETKDEGRHSSGGPEDLHAEDQEAQQAVQVEVSLDARMSQQITIVPRPPSRVSVCAYLDEYRSLLSLLIWAAFALLVASHNDWLKRRLWAPPVDGLEHTLKAVDGTWKYGPFSCLGDPRICIFTVLFFPVRWADTMHMAGLFGFWLAVGGFMTTLLYLHMLALGFIHGGIPVWLRTIFGAALGLTLLLVQASQRRKLRERFRIEGGLAGDLLLYALCPLCAVCQEARHVEEAHAVGHPATEEAHARGVASHKLR